MKKTRFINAGLLMLIALLVCFSNIYAQDTTILQPGPDGKDTYVCDCLPNVNNPNGPITVLYQGQYGICFDRFLIQWDISSLPKNISISSAIMELKCSNIYGSISGRPVYYRVTGNWEETQVTVATLPTYTKEDSVATDWPTVGQWHSVDITKFVQKWIQDTTSNCGIYGHCAGTTGQCDAEFYSSDASVSNSRPKLTITYASTKVENLKPSQPMNFHLGQNYPNPFNPTTKIQYTIPRNEFVSLKVFDLLGNEIVTLVNQRQNAGTYESLFDASHLTSGIFLYELRAGNYHDAKKLMLLK